MAETPDFTARAIVEAIIDDLTGRRGLRHEWDNIDDDIQEEIRKAWRTIAFEKIVGAGEEPSP